MSGSPRFCNMFNQVSVFRGPHIAQSYVRHICRAYAADTGITIKSLHWLFMMKYLDFDSLMRAASTGDVSPCQTDAGRVAYDTIEECIRRAGNNIRSLSSGSRCLLDSDPLLGSGFFG